MKIKLQCIALYTLIYHEITRMLRVSLQVFLPPVISTLLYFLIFGEIIGQRIGFVDGIPYSMYIAPGLVMISVITNSYVNVSSSLFSARFQKSIEEMLISPMHYSILLLGYVLSGVLRGIITAIVIIIVAAFFIHIELKNIPLTLCMVSLISGLFSLIGFINGMLAHTFDDVALVPSFILSPLAYLGGVFYSISMLPPIWQKISQFNPIVYMINLLRFAMIGQNTPHLFSSITIIIVTLTLLIWINCTLLKRGVGIRD